jgi:hypothetical protein
LRAWEAEAVSDDTLAALYAKLGTKQTPAFFSRASGKRSSFKPLPIIHAEKRPSPASDLPSWDWSLSSDQKSLEIRSIRLDEFIQVRPNVKIDKEAYANLLSWVDLPLREKQERIDNLPLLRQQEVYASIVELESLRSAFIQRT